MPMMEIVADVAAVYVDRHARPGTAFRRAAIVHVGQSAVVLRPVEREHENPDGLLVITTDSAGLMPGGMRISRADFTARHPRFAALHASGTLVDATPRTHSANAIDLHIRPATTHPSALGVLHRGMSTARPDAAGTRAATGALNVTSALDVMDPEPLRRHAPLLAAAAVNTASADVRRLVGSLIGAGPGTTPTGDDIIVGALAACRLIDDREAFAVIAGAVAPLLANTTAASRHYLHAAIDGRFGEHIHELVAAATGRSSPTMAVARAQSWGSSSGLDTLAGFLAVLSTQRMDDLSMERSA
jgi:hypothetical protein